MELPAACSTPKSSVASQPYPSQDPCTNLDSPGTCGVELPAACFIYIWLPARQEQNKMVKTYKSPAKLKRNLTRLVKHLSQILNRKTKVSSKPQVLSSSLPSFTSYPNPCNICHQHQCSYDLSHALVFSLEKTLLAPLVSKLSDVLEESNTYFSNSVSKIQNWKPPDDIGG